MRWNTAGAGQQQQSQKQLWNASYLEQAPVDTKRGKWWLKERQVLSRNVPSPVDDCIAIKVREVWLWSGRTVIVDKIVTCPIMDDVDHDTFDNEDESHGQGSYRDKSATRAVPLSPASSGHLSPRTSTAPSSPKYSDAKQLAQEFLQQPKAASPAVIATAHSKDSLDTASARTEQQMSHAATGT
uniref:Uncharacterized protein n=1 Tax=Globisporangium ultimum (strain ATCC 200006 / CBS 805.95 / DAOM BR144) TaxID=431595 RepID=K3X2D2_GLOUD